MGEGKLGFSGNKTVCGMENCHGLEITCGPNIPEGFDLMFQIEDICRQFTSCQVINNRCQLVLDEKFYKCRQCLRECQERNANNQEAIVNCAMECQ